MKLFADLLIGLSALSHLGFMYLEMFLWTKPIGRKIFRRTEQQAIESAPLAINQGLYNGFLAAGLIWGLVHSNPDTAWQIKVFFLICVVIAGLVGAATANKRILFVQALPAALALVFLNL